MVSPGLVVSCCLINFTSLFLFPLVSLSESDTHFNVTVYLNGTLFVLRILHENVVAIEAQFEQQKSTACCSELSLDAMHASLEVTQTVIHWQSICH